MICLYFFYLMKIVFSDCDCEYFGYRTPFILLIRGICFSFPSHTLGAHIQQNICFQIVCVFSVKDFLILHIDKLDSCVICELYLGNLRGEYILFILFFFFRLIVLFVGAMIVCSPLWPVEGVYAQCVCISGSEVLELMQSILLHCLCFQFLEMQFIINLSSSYVGIFCLHA